MTLDQYLKLGTDTAAGLAERCGISAVSISRVRRGRQNITLSLARKIEAETGGQVTIADLAMELEA